MTDFYVYIHLKVTTGEIFYVGKGKDNRAYERGRNTHWDNTVKKHGYTVEIIETGLQEWYALELERELIAYHGRMDLGLGPLVNWTDGGEGQSNPNPEVRKRMSVSAKLRDASVYDCHRGENNHMKTQFSKDRMSKIKTGVRRTDLEGDNNPAKRDEVRKKISDAFSNGKHHLAKPVMCLETGTIFCSTVLAVAWLKTINKSGDVKGCALGYYKTAGTMHWKYI